MSKAFLSSFRTAVLLTLFFNLVCFLIFLSRALRCCRSPANIFSTPPINSPPLPIFTKKISSPSPIRSHLKTIIPSLLRKGGRGGGVCANYGFIYRNKCPPLHFIFTAPPPLPPHFNGTFAISRQSYFIMTPQFMNI